MPDSTPAPGRAVFPAMCLAALLIAPIAQAQTIRGAGARPCTDWNQARKGGGHDYEAEQWALGYLSAVTTGATRPAAAMDAKAVFGGMDGYCAGHPQAMVWDAVKAALRVPHGA